MRMLTKYSVSDNNKLSGAGNMTSSYWTKNRLISRHYRFLAVHQLQQRNVAATVKYSEWFRRFVPEGLYEL
jgi:hypothetical protein